MEITSLITKKPWRPTLVLRRLCFISSRTIRTWHRLAGVGRRNVPKMEPEPVPSDGKEASFFCATKDSSFKTGLNLAERTGFTKRHSAGTLPDEERTELRPQWRNHRRQTHQRGSMTQKGEMKPATFPLKWFPLCSASVTASSRRPGAFTGASVRDTLWWALSRLLEAYMGEWHDWSPSDLQVNVEIKLHPESKIFCLAHPGGSAQHQDYVDQKAYTSS
jgi:hypothetical protein